MLQQPIRKPTRDSDKEGWKGLIMSGCEEGKQCDDPGLRGSLTDK